MIFFGGAPPKPNAPSQEITEIRPYQGSITPPKINIEPEDDGLEHDFPFERVYSHVNLPGCNHHCP